MTIARLAGAALALVGLTGPALAVCPICNSSVRLDADLAACFAKRADIEIARAESEGRGFVIVNLSDCPAGESRQALPTVTSTPSAKLDSTFVADGVALKCLSEAIAAHQGPYDPSVVFDLAQICT
jgi:hypothetical protein